MLSAVLLAGLCWSGLTVSEELQKWDANHGTKLAASAQAATVAGIYFQVRAGTLVKARLQKRCAFKQTYAAPAFPCASPGDW
jgi:hypothetical protein